MAWQAPRLVKPKPARKAWTRPANEPDRRKRGRAGQRERAQVLAEEPLCRLCLAEGTETRSEEVDHIKPLSRGGSDDRANKQALCVPHHRAKTRAEAARRAPRA